MYVVKLLNNCVDSYSTQHKDYVDFLCDYTPHKIMTQIIHGRLRLCSFHSIYKNQFSTMDNIFYILTLLEAQPKYIINNDSIQSAVAIHK